MSRCECRDDATLKLHRSIVMIILGRVSKETKGPVVPGFAETIDLLTLGNKYPRN